MAFFYRLKSFNSTWFRVINSVGYFQSHLYFFIFNVHWLMIQISAYKWWKLNCFSKLQLEFTFLHSVLNAQFFYMVCWMNSKWPHTSFQSDKCQEHNYSRLPNNSHGTIISFVKFSSLYFLIRTIATKKDFSIHFSDCYVFEWIRTKLTWSDSLWLQFIKSYQKKCIFIDFWSVFS